MADSGTSAPASIRTREHALTPETVYRLLVARTFGGQIRIYVFNGVIVALIIASLIYTVADLSGAAGIAVLIALLAVVALALGYPLWRYRRYVHSPTNAHLFAPVHHTIDAQFIAVHHAGGQVARTPLTSVTRAIRTPEHWLLYVGGLVQHVIPLTAFESPDDSAQLETWLTARGVFVQQTRRT